ncbi:STAM-binding protein-like A [Sitophilus oryzae]|uniref:STAM-binding protein-like A n=1 Tax=Sitophilus oryzae TaxID=7048 RepID=A0A6J2Y5B8_SITOR|nr:STAM-binding protein-like A [Sitophilus oryzae]
MAESAISSILDSIEPQERLKRLIDFSNLIQVEPHIPPIRYYRSGLEMVRMANVYYKEENFENAYCLYLKFMTLFLEKIRKHPDFNTVPANMRSAIQAKLREVLPRAEKLKEKLLEVYRQDYEKYCAHLLKLQDDENERRRRENLAKKDQQKSKKPAVLPSDFLTANIPGSIDSVNYPDPNVPTPKPSAPELPPPYESDFCFPTTPAFDRSKKPSDHIIASDKYDSGALKTVVVPGRVMSSFENMAQSNTNKNIETCGILAGKLEKNQLIITHMIIPKQTGTSDSCTTKNEEELFDYQDQHNLITIGWIHTHPTQTAFLSSVDLHTHCPYQLLMPEAIAIVCSPKYKETGFFILTPNYGLQYIANCRNAGFHPHPSDPPLFKKADHVRIDNGAHLEVLDLRK